MTLAEFHAFCWRQWEDYGTVESIRLPSPALCEMTAEVITRASVTAAASPGSPPRIAAGARIACAENPASKTMVAFAVALDGAPATAVVRYGHDRPVTRTVPVRT